MKKILFTLITFTLLIFPALAQEAVEEETVIEIPSEETVTEPEEIEEEYIEIKTSFDLPMKIGGNFSVSIPAGSLREFAGTGFGGGIDYEIGIPIPLLQDMPFAGMLFQNFAAGARADFNYHLPNSEELSSLMNLQIVAAALTSIPLAETGLSAVPEIGIGLNINLPKEKNEPKTLRPAYVDQIYTFGCGFRFVHENLLDEKLELTFTPLYSVSPEHGTAVHNFTFKFGAMYKIN